MVLGYPEFGIRFQRRLDFAPWAEACGGRGIRVDKADDLDGALREAFAFDGPAIVEQPDTTTVMPPGTLCTSDKYGNLIIRVER